MLLPLCASHCPKYRPMELATPHRKSSNQSDSPYNPYLAGWTVAAHVMLVRLTFIARHLEGHSCAGG